MSNRTPGQVLVESGLGFGSALAICISWSLNKSVLWAILHGVGGWLYVVYYAMGGGR